VVGWTNAAGLVRFYLFMINREASSMAAVASVSFVICLFTASTDQAMVLDAGSVRR
jgi:hypothetical protein